MKEQFCVDSIDVQILNILQQDAGISNSELAEKISLSPSP
ncbi:MAG: Lrp/AsnC family transcriptional regulator, partial [Gammaproteobacteria bacterium]